MYGAIAAAVEEGDGGARGRQLTLGLQFAARRHERRVRGRASDRQDRRDYRRRGA